MASSHDKTDSPLLAAQGLKKTYRLGRVSVEVLRGASLTVRPGESLAIVGASGSGKSTLLHLLGALDEPDAGTLSFEGRDVFALSNRQRNLLRNKRFGFVFQFYHLLPELSVLENVLLPGMVSHSAGGWFGQRRRLRQQARELLELLGLGHRLRHRPSELSGGERQRTAIARALVNQPTVLLADEPTGNLDAATGESILAALRKINQQRNQTLVMVTHDPKVASYCDRTVVLQNGRVQSA